MQIANFGAGFSAFLVVVMIFMSIVFNLPFWVRRIVAAAGFALVAYLAYLTSVDGDLYAAIGAVFSAMLSIAFWMR